MYVGMYRMQGKTKERIDFCSLPTSHMLRVKRINCIYKNKF